MKTIRALFDVGYFTIIISFIGCAFSLIGFAGLELWHALDPTQTLPPRERFDSVLECIGLSTIAVAALELGQTIFEEEILRKAHMSAPTRVRRFLSRFMVVIIVSLSIECLVAVFQLIHSDPAHLPQASIVGIAAAALLAAWGLFIQLNRSAEELEPEAMEHAKSEDHKVQADTPIHKDNQ